MDDQQQAITGGDSLDASASPAPSPSSSRPSGVCIATHLTSAAVSVTVAWPIGQALPTLAADTAGPWWRFPSALLALVIVAAPASVIPAARDVITRLLPGGRGK